MRPLSALIHVKRVIQSAVLVFHYNLCRPLLVIPVRFNMKIQSVFPDGSRLHTAYPGSGVPRYRNLIIHIGLQLHRNIPTFRLQTVNILRENQKVCLRLINTHRILQTIPADNNVPLPLLELIVLTDDQIERLRLRLLRLRCLLYPCFKFPRNRQMAIDVARQLNGNISTFLPHVKLGFRRNQRILMLLRDLNRPCLIPRLDRQHRITVRIFMISTRHHLHRSIPLAARHIRLAPPALIPDAPLRVTLDIETRLSALCLHHQIILRHIQLYISRHIGIFGLFRILRHIRVVNSVIFRTATPQRKRQQQYEQIKQSFHNQIFLKKLIQLIPFIV